MIRGTVSLSKSLEKSTLLYEGKAKKVFTTNDPDLLIVSYKDDATAFNGQKKGVILGKGRVNNKLTNYFMKLLELKGVPTHFVEELSETDSVVKKVDIVPLEVIVRNRAAGSFSKRYGVKEGTELKKSCLEFSLKNDDLNDPLINSYHILALEIASENELEIIENFAFEINQILKAYLYGVGVELIDFKLEFGKNAQGEIVLADEISPDTCRFWDLATHEKLDKDRFRQNLNDVNFGYEQMYFRIFNS